MNNRHNALNINSYPEPSCRYNPLMTLHFVYPPLQSLLLTMPLNNARVVKVTSKSLCYPLRLSVHATVHNTLLFPDHLSTKSAHPPLNLLRYLTRSCHLQHLILNVALNCASPDDRRSLEQHRLLQTSFNVSGQCHSQEDHCAVILI